MTGQSRTDQARQIEEAEEAVVTFHPQIWHDNRAITSDDPERFTVPIEDALTPEGELLEDDTGESDQLRHHENAPERAQQWDGPFYVTIDEVR
jgi:hypothetical protein